MKKLLISFLIITNCIAVKSQFKGGGGDGYAGIPTYSQPFVTIFSGGQNDGFATAFYNQVGAPLPIILTVFSGKKINQINVLNWQTSQELNASHFEIERSTDSKIFEKIGKVNANKAENYHFNDNSYLIVHHSSLIFYRLRLLDIDGKFTYSKIIYIENTDNEAIVGYFYPNPATGNSAEIEVKATGNGKWTITQFDPTGKLLFDETVYLLKGQNIVKVKSQRLGMKIFQIENENFIFQRKVIFK